MKTIILSCILSMILYNTVRGDKYTDKYDSVDLDKILQNDRLLTNYVNCLLDKGKCTTDGEELKAHVKEALETDCAKCTEKQKEGMKKVIVFLSKNKPDLLKELAEKFDHDGVFKTKYADVLEAEGIKL